MLAGRRIAEAGGAVRRSVLSAIRQACGSERGEGVLATRRIADSWPLARRRRFVGREAEIEIFRAALLADEPPFVVLHLHGAGGVWKNHAAPGVRARRG
jgi:hypothetical protein